MDLADFVQLLEDLGKEMVRLEMHDHVKLAREFYVELRARWNRDGGVESEAEGSG